MKISNIFKTMPYVELIEVDKVDAACHGVYSGCYFKRTKEKLPEIVLAATLCVTTEIFPMVAF